VRMPSANRRYWGTSVSCPPEHPDTNAIQKQAWKRRISRLPSLDKVIQRRIKEDKLQFDCRSMLSTAKVSESSLSKEILECEFLKKFSTLTFDCYSRMGDPVQHIRHFRDKMVIYSRNNLIMCLTFPSNLKGVTSDCSTPCLHNLSTTLRCPKRSSPSKHLAGRLRGTTAIFPPLR